MSDDQVKKLELRVQQLEQLLASAPQRTQAASLTADELKAYQKVRDVIAADWGEFCGINDCFRCIILRCGTSRCVVRCVVRCINECVCGPCIQGDLGTFEGGLSRFGGLAE